MRVRAGAVRKLRVEKAQAAVGEELPACLIRSSLLLLLMMMLY